MNDNVIDNVTPISKNENKFPYSTNDSNVICQLCGKEFKTITPHHLKKFHDIPINEYREMFPAAPLVSKATILKKAYTNKHIADKKKKQKEDDIKRIESKNVPISEMTEDEIQNIIDKEKKIPDESINIKSYDISTKFKEEYLKRNPKSKNRSPVKKVPVKTSVDNTRDLIEEKLKTTFSHIKRNYTIQKILNNNIIYSFITDYADPILKVAINFPDVFWHNNDRFHDPNKNIKLKTDGWKIIEVFKYDDMMKKIKEVLE